MKLLKYVGLYMQQMDYKGVKLLVILNICERSNVFVARMETRILEEL
jgi:hypothetical protein